MVLKWEKITFNGRFEFLAAKMGSAASFMSDSARVILAQAEDASDILSVEDGKREISKMRKLILHGMVASGKYDGDNHVLMTSKVPNVTCTPGLIVPFPCATQHNKPQ